MKNQYVGDINDFRKYGLLRALSGDGAIRTGVCWMLTDNDTRNDGQFISYLDAPQTWRDYAPEIFDSLAKCVREEGGRDVERIEAAGILHDMTFFSNLVQDSAAERRHYFEEMKAQLSGTDLVFFDPDNGLEIKSCPIGRRNSNKFLFWNELADTFAAGQSVLVYQHFNRSHPREVLISRIVSEAARITCALDVWTFRTAQTFFLLVSQTKHREHFAQQTEQLAPIWGKQFQVLHHDITAETEAAN